MIHNDYTQSLEKFDLAIKTLKNTLQQEYNHYERELESLGEHDILQTIENESDQMLIDFEIPEEVDTDNKDILEIVDARKKRTQHILAQFEVVMQHAKSRLSMGIEEMESNNEGTQRLHELHERMERSRLSEKLSKSTAHLSRSTNIPSDSPNEPKPRSSLRFLSKSQPLTVNNPVETQTQEQPFDEIENEEPRDLNSLPLPRPADEKIHASDLMQQILTVTPRSKIFI